MPVAPKDAVYQTGPDDSLRVVDVYGNGTVAEAFELLSTTQYIETEGGAGLKIDPTILPNEEQKSSATQVLRKSILSGESDIAISELLALNLSSKNNALFISERLPSNVSSKTLLEAFPDMSVAELNETLKALSDQPDYSSLTQPSLEKRIIAHSNAVTALEAGVFGDGSELSSIDVRGADTRADVIRKINASSSNSEAKQAVNRVAACGAIDTKNMSRNEQVTAALNNATDEPLRDKERRAVEREVIKNASKDGNHRLVTDIMEISEEGFEPWFRRQNAIDLLENYGFDFALPDDQKELAGKILRSDIERIDPTLFVLEKADTPTYLLDIYSRISEDGLDALSSSDGVGLVLAVMESGELKSGSKERRINDTLDGLMA